MNSKKWWQNCHAKLIVFWWFYYFPVVMEMEMLVTQANYNCIHFIDDNTQIHFSCRMCYIWQSKRENQVKKAIISDHICLIESTAIQLF